MYDFTNRGTGVNNGARVGMVVDIISSALLIKIQLGLNNCTTERSNVI